MFLVVLVLAFVAAAVWPGEGAIPAHLVPCPATSVDAPIYPLVRSIPFDVVSKELTAVLTPIWPLKHPIPRLHAI
jgi:hypothetical protein